MPVVPRMEMPPAMPRRALVVFSAICSPPGTEKTTSTDRSVTSDSAARIMRRGTGLIAGAPTGRPKPGKVMVPIPGPATRREAFSPDGRHETDAVIRAPLVQSGSSPASLTTTQLAGSTDSTGNETRVPLGRATSTSGGALPVTRARAAALAAAEAQVPVVQPVRRPFGVTPGGRRWSRVPNGAGTGGRT